MAARQDVQHEETDSHSPGPTSRLWGNLALGFAFYYLTSLVVVVAVVFAVDFVPVCARHPESNTRVDVPSAFSAWDGAWYVRIASVGYTYDPECMSTVAFFPLYPMLARTLVHFTGMRAEWALLLVSLGALVGVFSLLSAYVHRRFPGADLGLAEFTLLAIGLFPTTFYLRMAYTESVFLLVILLVLYGMERDWPLPVVASVVGLATAARTVGVALIPVLALYVWQRLRSGEASRSALHGRSDGPSLASDAAMLGRTISRTLSSWLVRVILLLPICCWGLLAYVLFQWVVFDEPLAFIKTQAHWTSHPMGFWENLGKLMTLEPLRAVYDPTSRCYWGRVPPEGNVLFNLKAANPVYFVAAVALVGLGMYKRWLNSRELLLSAGLLLIPYCLQSVRGDMMSQARYASVVFPVYIVLGHLLHRAPPALAGAMLAISGMFLAIYSAMFASWYWFY